MARPKEIRVDIVNPISRDKMGYITSEYPDKNTQEVLDMAIDCLFRREYECIQSKLSKLLVENA